MITLFIICLIFLIYFSYLDLKYNEIDNWPIFLLFSIGVIYRAFIHDVWAVLVAVLLIGCLSYVLWTKKAVGGADFKLLIAMVPFLAFKGMPNMLITIWFFLVELLIIGIVYAIVYKLISTYYIKNRTMKCEICDKELTKFKEKYTKSNTCSRKCSLKKYWNKIDKKERFKDLKGYIRMRDDQGYRITEHRYVWQKINGKIPKGFIIHHINRIKDDNRIENLQCVSFHEHAKLHRAYKLEKAIPNNSSIPFIPAILITFVISWTFKFS
jgi:Flp pilus assembly protein protease CpaA